MRKLGKVSRFQSFRVSRFQSFKVSREWGASLLIVPTERIPRIALLAPRKDEAGSGWSGALGALHVEMLPIHVGKRRSGASDR
jgi:hypothetical protein